MLPLFEFLFCILNLCFFALSRLSLWLLCQSMWGLWCLLSSLHWCASIFYHIFTISFEECAKVSGYQRKKNTRTKTKFIYFVCAPFCKYTQYRKSLFVVSFLLVSKVNAKYIKTFAKTDLNIRRKMMIALSLVHSSHMQNNIMPHSFILTCLPFVTCGLTVAMILLHKIWFIGFFEERDV